MYGRHRLRNSTALLREDRRAAPRDDHIRNDPVILNLLTRMPERTSESFSDAQLTCLKKAMMARQSKHAIDWRGTIPFFKKRYYFALVAGKSRRKLTKPEKAFVDGAQALVFLSFSTWIFVTLFFSLYLIKSLLGINIFPNASVAFPFK